MSATPQKSNPSQSIFREIELAQHGLRWDGVHDGCLASLGCAVYEHMQQYDGSHDWQHVERVMRLAVTIYNEELLARPKNEYNLTTVVLAALMHDVADKKYAISSDLGEGEAVMLLLSKHNVTEVDHNAIVEIVENVSYSHECKHPDKVKEVLKRHPELAIVQDADRLDALGAVGIGRTFMYSGAKAVPRGMDDTLDHFADKLFKLQDLMKTTSGRKMALERTEKMRTFMRWWEEETHSLESNTSTN